MSHSTFVIPTLDQDIQALQEEHKDVLDRLEKNPHITFCYFGRASPCTDEMKETIEALWNDLSESDKEIQLDKFTTFKTRRGPLLVCLIQCSNKLIELRNTIYEKYHIIDHIIDHNPHITIGKLKPEISIIQKNAKRFQKYSIEKLKYHD
jgi:2'-5' RNA ligase